MSFVEKENASQKKQIEPEFVQEGVTKRFDIMLQTLAEEMVTSNEVDFKHPDALALVSTLTQHSAAIHKIFSEQLETAVYGSPIDGGKQARPDPKSMVKNANELPKRISKTIGETQKQIKGLLPISTSNDLVHSTFQQFVMQLYQAIALETGKEVARKLNGLSPSAA